MKIHFEPDLDYQFQAIEAVCGLFYGQETCRTEFTVTKHSTHQSLPGMENDLGKPHTLVAILNQNGLETVRRL